MAIAPRFEVNGSKGKGITMFDAMDKYYGKGMPSVSRLLPLFDAQSILYNSNKESVCSAGRVWCLPLIAFSSEPLAKTMKTIGGKDFLVAESNGFIQMLQLPKRYSENKTVLECGKVVFVISSGIIPVREDENRYTYLVNHQNDMRTLQLPPAWGSSKPEMDPMIFKNSHDSTNLFLLAPKDEKTKIGLLSLWAPRLHNAHGTVTYVSIPGGPLSSTKKPLLRGMVLLEQMGRRSSAKPVEELF